VRARASVALRCAPHAPRSHRCVLPL